MSSAASPVIAVLSQGCAANFGDGEKIARALSAQHPDCSISFEFPTEQPLAFYLNVCTVKGNGTALKLLQQAITTFPQAPVFITGCAPKDFQEEARKISDKITFTSLKALESLDSIAPKGLQNDMRILRQSPFVGIVNIEEGCLDACAFCSTKLVKGRLQSQPEDAIVDQVRRLVDDGCLEIQLSGQDCACYGFDTGTNLANLTQKILAQVPGNYKIRLGMGNPRHILGYKDALLECFQDERLYQFLHVPVQSGSERVLQLMNRKHSVKDFRNFALELQEKFPLFTLSTDLIVGFPGETDADFQETLDLLKETRPTVCNITRFVARKGTVAARIEEANAADTPAVLDSVKHERSAKLFDAFQQIAQENNQRWVGKACTVVSEKQGHRAGTTIARNCAYRPVALQGNIPAGKALQVRITKAEPFALIGERL
ncbi:MiaB/RimO family radical SAM methylthiotransferase [Fibrobacter sp.]|uniref:MiaB/RimO family radical SAM methylthiotransferase n=1 Tax=Fibrobacter sp. TaxID=35828 RepID=UPI00388F1A09